METTDKETINCRLDAPYPPAEATAKNARYACLLSRNLAGAGGELTAICQYLYQHTISRPCWEKLSAALECIAGVEMRHMHLLMQLIEALGGDPKLIAYEPNCTMNWNSRYLEYGKNIRAFLCANIQAEKEAVAAYKKRICQIEDPKVRAVLQRIILDEEYHIRIFRSFLSQCC